MKYILTALLLFQEIHASDIRSLDLNNSTKDQIFAQSPEELDAFFSIPMKLSSTDIPNAELIEILKTAPHIWKMKLAHSIVRDIPDQLGLEELAFLRTFGKQFKGQYLRAEYDAYKTKIRELKQEIEHPARSFKPERRRSFLSDSSDSDA